MVEPTRQPRMTIRQLRQARGWAQLDVALEMDVSQRTVSRWERGELVPQPHQQQRLADLFGVSVEAIAFEPADPS